MSSRTQRTFGFAAGPTGPATVTRVLVFALLIVSLGASVTERKLGVGASLLDFRVERVLHGELWRLVTYPFIESSPLSLIVSLIVLWLFGNWFESRWGQRDFLRFFALATVGAALLAIPLSLLFNVILPFQDVGIAQGPGAALDAMLVAVALLASDSNMLLGFVLPMRARTVVLLLLGILVIFGVQTGAAALSIHVGGMLIGYLLVTGRWRPDRLLGALRELASRRRRRRALYVVPPRQRTLH